MGNRSVQTSTPGVDRAVLQGVAAGNAQRTDAPITAQALFCLGVFQVQKLSILWVADDAREMERLHESITTLQIRQNTDEASSLPLLFQPMEKDPAVFGEHLRIIQQLSQLESHTKTHDRAFLCDMQIMIITCPQALETEVPMEGKSEQAVRTLQTGTDCPLMELTEWMSDAGYEFGVEV